MLYSDNLLRLKTGQTFRDIRIQAVKRQNSSDKFGGFKHFQSQEIS